jgi:uncharacterized membrane protein
MKTENEVLMQMALESLKGKWKLAVGTCLLYFAIIVCVQMIPIAGPIVSLIIGGPLGLGLAHFILALSRNQNPELEQLFQGFNNFARALGAYLLIVIFTILWLILLIIPGIIAAISYSMTFYILAEDSSIGAMEAIDKSKKMMDGYKMKYFLLSLRFIGWALLCVLTAGIGFLWLMPYMQVSFAKFYDDIKESPVAVEEAI